MEHYSIRIKDNIENTYSVFIAFLNEEDILKAISLSGVEYRNYEQKRILTFDLGMIRKMDPEFKIWFDMEPAGYRVF